MNSKMPLRFIQVGVGVRGSHWARVFRDNPDAVVVAYVDLQKDLARERANQWGHSDIPCFSDLAQALQFVESDAVLLATPPEVHLHQSRLAFERGRHVLCEKPLAEDLAEAITIVRLAEQHARHLMIGMNFRYLPVTQAIRKMIRDETYGAPSYGQFVYTRNRDGRRADLNKYPLTMKQPMLLEQSVHHLDLMRYGYGREVQAVSAMTWRPPWSTYADDCCVAALLRFEEGLQVNYLGTWTAGWNGFEFEWRTDCPGGMIRQDSMFGDLKVATLQPGLAMQGKLNKTLQEAEPLEPVNLPLTEMYISDTRGLLNEFVSTLRDGKPMVTSGRDHIRTLSLVFGIIEAAERGEWVEMRSFYSRHHVPAEWY